MNARLFPQNIRKLSLVPPWSIFFCFFISLQFSNSPSFAEQHATKPGAIGQRAEAAVHQRDMETAIKLRQTLPIMPLERRSETATANNRANLAVIDNVVGKALEILALAFGVAVVVSSVIEQKDRKEQQKGIAVGSTFVLIGLLLPRLIHAVCNFAGRTLFP